jgi:hypothetical protein
MASIYFKESGNGLGHNLLVLEPREALVYPFDFGTGWNRLQAGAFISFAGITGDLNDDYNHIPSQEILSTVSIKSNNFYFGFTTKNAAFPQTVNNTYLGFGASSFFKTTQILSSKIESFSAMASISTLYTNLPGGITQNFLVTNFSGFTGLKPLSFFLSFQIGKSSDSQIISGAQGSNISTAQTLDFSEKILRKNMNSESYLGGHHVVATLTGVGYTGSLPDSLIIYNPFYLNKLRIHNIGVVKVD